MYHVVMSLCLNYLARAFQRAALSLTKLLMLPLTVDTKVLSICLCVAGSLGLRKKRGVGGAVGVNGLM